MEDFEATEYDVIILGGGLAGLTLARQLLRETGKRILHLERRTKIPATRQKVGEATVQLSAYYYGKVLDMEEHLLHEHLMKYNLRFLWKTPRSNDEDYGEYSQSYIRQLSNIPCYQIDRNKFEAELIAMNGTDSRWELVTGIQELKVNLNKGRAHEVGFKVGEAERKVTAAWIVDATGRGRFLARKQGLDRTGEIRHNTSFFWVDGIINIEKLTPASPQGIRLRKTRSKLGHLPTWLATNHFMGKGYWFWVIPLQGRTSFGLVYDSSLVDPALVSTQEGLLAWVYENFPLFKSGLEGKPIVDFTRLPDFAHDCEYTISEDRWAMTGEAGRFTDPLYSPGGDSIAIHNTLIVDAIKAANESDLKSKVSLYEPMLKSFYQSFVPSYCRSYRCLGDQEAFSMKYIWELSVYFSFYVFPFVNDMFTERAFLLSFFSRFATLGPINRNVQEYITDFFDWKREVGMDPPDLSFFEFTLAEPLMRAEDAFYKVGLTPEEVIAELDKHLINLKELALALVAHIDSVVAGNPALLYSREHIAKIDLKKLSFNRNPVSSGSADMFPERDPYPWTWDVSAFRKHFHSQGVPQGAETA